jgi:3-deoxy-D-manno-octulosonic-acid transferase
MSLYIYRLLKILLAPVIFVVMFWRIVRGREQRELFHERLGRPETERPQGPLVWLHGASVGEVVSYFPVLQKLREARPGLPLLLTTGTATGRSIMAKRVPSLPGTGPIITQYAPLDTSSAAAGFFKHWKPDVSVFVESDFWPELLARAPRPILMNGRISNRSWPRYQRWGWFFRPLLKRFVKVLAQSDVDAERLSKLGARRVEVGGNLKFDADPLPVDDTAVEKFRTALQGRPVLVAASTHAGEEEIVAHLHQQLKAQVPDLLTVIVPRHPHRGTQAANAVQRIVRSVKRRGLGEMPVLGGARHTDVFIADTLGELGLWYRLARVVVMGGSLVKHGGHNPLEPMKLGIPTVTGPHMNNFMDMVPDLIIAELLTVILKAPSETALREALAKAIVPLLTDDAYHAQYVKRLQQEMPKREGSAALAAKAILELLQEA